MSPVDAEDRPRCNIPRPFFCSWGRYVRSSQVVVRFLMRRQSALASIPAGGPLCANPRLGTARLPLQLWRIDQPPVSGPGGMLV